MREEQEILAHAANIIIESYAIESHRPCDRVEQVMAALARVREHAGADTVGGRRRIGDALLSATRYPF